MFVGRCCSCVRNEWGRGGGCDCISIYGSGAEGRYPGVVFFPLGGSVS